MTYVGSGRDFADVSDAAIVAAISKAAQPASEAPRPLFRECRPPSRSRSARWARHWARPREPSKA
jgi:hypothetical protein